MFVCKTTAQKIISSDESKRFVSVSLNKYNYKEKESVT